MNRAITALFMLMVFAVPFSWGGQRSIATPSPNTKCPVCGMFVAKFPDWVCSITLRDGTALFFDGPKDLFKYYLSPGRYGAAIKPSEFISMTVKDYYTLEVRDGRRAYYVLGSDIFGPMGKELVPFATERDAQGFLKDHGGRRILRFQEITPAVLKSLD
jgi:nitrous oxide reductase accessory protein NosL